MTDPTSPLTPRNSNCNTSRTTVKSSTFQHSEKLIYSTFDEDTENLPIEDSIFACPSPSSAIKLDLLPPSTIQQPPPQQENSFDEAVILEQTPRTTPGKEALWENDGLRSSLTKPEDVGNGPTELDGDDHAPMGTPQGYSGMDDTNFTAFSAVPNADMALFAQARQSPNKNGPDSPAKGWRQAQYGDARRTPRPNGSSTPGGMLPDSYADCSPTPSPRRPKSSYGADTTNLILDFTEQFNAISRHSPYKGNHKTPKKSQTQPELATYLSNRRAPSPTKQGPRPTTPTGPRHLASLLDFDFPPAPTPRSVPSITARELESLKSSFLSQVSSLRATLSGKEAEVNSLKEAVTDAERRVGEALEEIRDLKNARGDLQAEKTAWESRDKEMQNVLRKVKEEVMWADRERDQVQQKLDESERRCLEAEARTVEVECQLAGLANFDANTVSGDGNSVDSNNVEESVRTAVLKLAQDLHGLYKSKHELKIDSLKESYKRRYGRQIGALESKLDEVNRENEELRAVKDNTFSRILPTDLVPHSPLSPPPQQAGGDRAHASSFSSSEQDKLATEMERAMESQRREEQEARLLALEQQLATTKRNNETLHAQLETERLGMAELVAATEEMMLLSEGGAARAGQGQGPGQGSGAAEPGFASSMSLESLRGSISRASSGLRVPSGGVGGLGAMGAMGGVGGMSGVGGVGAGTGPLTTGLGESRIGKFGSSGAGRNFGLSSVGSGMSIGGGGGGRIGLKGRP